MALSFRRLSCWLRGENNKEATSDESWSNSASELSLGSKEPENLKFPSVKKGKTATTVVNVKRKWNKREYSRIDPEYDAVMVPSDGVCLSWPESVGSDWSVGWLEPHGPNFQSDDATDDHFAVLVPCYTPGCNELVEIQNNHFLLKEPFQMHNLDSASSKKNFEQWLSSLENC